MTCLHYINLVGVTFGIRVRYPRPNLFDMPVFVGDFQIMLTRLADDLDRSLREGALRIGIDDFKLLLPGIPKVHAAAIRAPLVAAHPGAFKSNTVVIAGPVITRFDGHL